MDWAKHGAHWPLSDHSRHVASRPHRWHVQEMGRGPVALLLHGAGGATHSFRHLMPELAQTHRVIAIDLPGQGFTKLGTKRRSSLDMMAEDVAALIAQEGWAPALLIGHSAGAALALRLSQLLPSPPGRIVGINPALADFGGTANQLFSGLAKLLAANPLTANLFSLTSSSPQSVRRMIAGTGSELDEEGLRLYRQLVSSRAHVDATLAMMANWSLGPLRRDLPLIATATLFIVGTGDRAVPPRTAHEAAAAMPDARVAEIAGGHLVHEEDPAAVARLILDFVADAQDQSALQD